jgi:hypothetical protein
VEPKYFDFSDIDEVTVFSDNVLPAVLRKLGILEVVDNDLVQVIANRQALPSGKCRRNKFVCVRPGNPLFQVRRKLNFVCVQCTLARRLSNM